MFVVNNIVYNLDIQLHRLQQRITRSSNVELQETPSDVNQNKDIETLERISDSLSIASRSQPALRASRIARLISECPQTRVVCGQSSGLHSSSPVITDLSWIVAARAAVQTFGLVLESLSENTIAITDELTYWDSLLESQWYMGLYTAQTFPVWLWHKLGHQSSAWLSPGIWTRTILTSDAWHHFHHSARRRVFSRTMSTVRKGLLLPLLASKLEVRQKRKMLHVAKDVNAGALGFLVERCLQIDLDDDLIGSHGDSSVSDEWCSKIIDSVTLLGLVLQHLASGGTLHEFELKTTAAAEKEGSLLHVHSDGTVCPKGPYYVIGKLDQINQTLIPQYLALTQKSTSGLGRPSFIVRYWLPFLLATLSTSTILEIFKARRHELLGWITDIGSTTIEFWNNWVVDPLKRLVGTIRHDEKSEIALMSKNSLEADRASLERMVVDFVLDHREPSDESLASAEMNTIMNKVREGDLTPVLRAYEKDLRTPFIGTIRGDLVRALLIQIQKTKVDVEVAIGGIDALLRSQELVFGFVGLTPGLLVSYASVHWLFGMFGSRKGLRLGRRQHELRHALRQVHRNLTLSTVTASGTLAFRDYGLLICNTEILLQKAQAMLRGADIHAFQEDINDIISKRSAQKQIKVVERMGWVYSRWL
ncbi:ATP synthase regulation protein NCA2 [Aspergillus aculeatinus CBS 121060]|uniref:ATP synthase regulation protein NCA2 n=1 Tax=Aspergillus aculeatinus CBS 121060 TaxID=1448322 RepID=A0ACD1HEC6_9EURO|nr:ATP synthase regulation protein NCA2 [Aspergillus aculeatinus CBS 121060]RAH71919.1 ATP synthase regulation protein NCA2 [Aspergillus aculeatinus CBS 121060]